MSRKSKMGIHAGLLLLAVSFVLIASKVGEEGSQKKYDWEPTDNIPQIVKAMDLDKSFSFCGEPLPMDNFDVSERLDRELTVNAYWQSSTILAIKSTMRFFPVMDRILEEEGVPADLKFIAVAESSLRNAVSPAGAKGIWQFMKGTGTDYGLEISEEIDERYHLEKSTRAAAKYLKSLRNRFGSWANAAAAYNMGGGNMSKHLAEQRTDNYFDLNLNEETSRYYFRLVALKYIMEHPREYGFYLDKEDYYNPLKDFRVVKVDTSISSWGDFAKEQGVSYRMLKIYNPWLVSSKLTNKSGKVYEVRIPGDV
ncbi:MAG: lytic transglycosylase domain-containing protein [Saprospiraceae bacterium]